MKSITSTKQIDSILNPMPFLENINEELIKLYKSDYGNKYNEYLISQLDQINYNFSSLPPDTYTFLKNNKLSLNSEMSFKVEKEYQDFLIIKQELEKKLISKSYLLFCKYFNINSYEHKKDMEEIIQLPIILFSSIFNKIVSNEIITFSFSTKIETLLSSYLKECSNLHIKPLTDSNKIDKLINELSNLKVQLEIELLTKSLFGKRQLQELSKITKTNIPPQLLHNIFYGAPSSCNMCCFDNKKFILIYLPLMNLFNRKCNIDNIFLHELRHAVEADYKHIGIASIDNEQAYNTFNELRTQIHANEDLKRIPLIFSREVGSYNLYDKILSLIAPFNYTYRYLLDNASITNNIKMLNNLFGPSFDELNKYLLNLLSYLEQANNLNLKFNASINGDLFQELYLKINKEAAKTQAQNFQKSIKRKFQ